MVRSGLGRLVVKSGPTEDPSIATFIYDPTTPPADSHRVPQSRRVDRPTSSNFIAFHSLCQRLPTHRIRRRRTKDQIRAPDSIARAPNRLDSECGYGTMRVMVYGTNEIAGSANILEGQGCSSAALKVARASIVSGLIAQPACEYLYSFAPGGSHPDGSHPEREHSD